MKDIKPKFIIQGNLLCNQPRKADYSEVAKYVAELNVLSAWEELPFFQKLWLMIAYPFRR